MSNYIKRQFNRLTSKDKDSQELIHGASLSFIMRGVGLATAQLFAFVVARHLGADAWGTFSLALSVITIGSIFGTLGLDIGLLRLVAGSDDPESASALYKKSFLMTGIVSLVCTLLFYYESEFIASVIFKKPELAESFRIASFAILPFSLMKLNSQTLRGLKRIKKYVFLNYVARYLFGLIILFLLLVVAGGDNSVLISYNIGLYVIVAISFFWLYKEEVVFPSIDVADSYNKGLYSKLLKISIPLLLASSLTFVKGWIDSIMVGIFLTKADVGVYNIALKLSRVIAIVLTAVNTIAAPKFAEVYRTGNKKKLENVVQKSTKMIFYASTPLLIIFLLFPGFILSLFGPEFVAGKRALILLSLGNFINAIAGSVGYFMQMTGSHIAFQNITLGSTILGIALNYFLIPIYGIEGAAFATCIGLILWNLTCVLFIKGKYNITTYFNPFRP